MKKASDGRFDSKLSKEDLLHSVSSRGKARNHSQGFRRQLNKDFPNEIKYSINRAPRVANQQIIKEATISSTNQNYSTVNNMSSRIH